MSGNKQITADTAIQLAAVFGNDPEEWLALDASFRIRMSGNIDVSQIQKRAALFERGPIKQLEKRGWIEPGANIDELAASVERFFGDDLSIFTRRSSSEELNRSQLAWCYRAAYLAKDMSVEKFSKARFEAGIDKLRALTVWPEEARKVPAVLAGMGVKFVVVEPLPKTRIDGATFWVDDCPVICLSLRFDRIDSFWHTLGHELSHVRHRDPVSVDTNIFGQGRDAIVDEIETRADREGSEMWVSESDMNKFIKRVSPFYEQKKVNRFASRLRVHPGIIVGQLQHRAEISYATFRPLLSKIRDNVIATAVTDGWGSAISI